MALNDDRGFTMIELVMIIVLLTIVAVVAGPRLANITGVKVSATARKLQADMTYTQNLAMTSNQRHRVVFPSTTSYEVRDASGALATNPHDGGGFTVTTDAGITMSWSFNGDSALNRGVEFDTLGRPYLYAGASPSATTIAVGTVTVTGGGTTRTVTVQPQTGQVSTP